TVTEINRILKRYLEGEPLFRRLIIHGEISNFRHHTSGHMYFVLKDAQSTMRCVMFRGHNTRLRFTPSDGMEVYATGAITIYETGGIYQLYVEHLEPGGIGDLHLAFEQLKIKLDKEGLFDVQKKRPLPFLPRRVGIVTSPTGAAVQDMVTILTRRMPQVEILIAPAVVQGKEAPSSIVENLNMLLQWGECDVIIVGRGGGSIEDLWAFNEEAVARAVFASQVPVISAVGHETDITICDFAADLRAPTPSAAAELAVPLVSALLEEVSVREIRLKTAWHRYLNARKERLLGVKRMLNSFNPVGVLRQRQQRLDELGQRLEESIQRQIKSNRRELTATVKLLDGLSPLAVVARGYGIITQRQTKDVVTSIKQIDINEEVDVMLQDGVLTAEVTEIKPNKA
ncbi:MAG: exodeoxyribonuclease VII large subunit, partial [Firmicutes bacterium]|nr:exodeoxyribonuclease VII large subunit [Bacillota bacterium]